MNMYNQNYENPRDLRLKYEKKQLVKLINAVGIFIISFFAFSFLFSAISSAIVFTFQLQNLESINQGFLGMQPYVYYILEFIMYILSLAFPAFVFFLVTKTSVKKTIPMSLKKSDPILVTMLFFLGLGVCETSNINSSTIINVLDFLGMSFPTPTTLDYNQDILSTIFYTVSIAVLPGILEELLFRGVILSSFRKYGDLFAIFISSFVFALLHPSLSQWIFAFILGLALGFIRIKTKSLLIPIGIHFINNLSSCIITILASVFPSEIPANIFYFFYSAVLLVSGGIAVIGLVKYYPDVFSFDKGSVALSFKEECSAIFKSPAFIIGVVLLVISMNISVVF
ncbi:MAG: CPBP family intramembrane metalloprotease [Clostridia bacterium]|nr:CPBP family intramembrane metalloprotease [Clostridia bacterium]